MTNHKKERAQKIMRAYEAEDTYNFPNDGVAAAIREVADQLYHDPDVDYLYRLSYNMEAL